MTIDANLVAQLRTLTGAGIMDAKSALEEADGDLDKAAEVLRKKGVAKAEKKSERETGEGRVHAYIHSTGKLGAMIEVLCETDFVARNEAFIEFCNDLAMHVGALEPLYVRREDIPEDVTAKQKNMFAEEMQAEAKPAEIVDKIVEGKMNKWYGDVVLLEQAFVKDEDMTILDFLNEKIATLGENIQIKRFCRFNIG